MTCSTQIPKHINADFMELNPNDMLCLDSGFFATSFLYSPSGNGHGSLKAGNVRLFFASNSSFLMQ